MTARAGWEAGVAEARRRYPAKYEAAEKVAAEAHEAARPEPRGELDGPIARTPEAEHLRLHGLDPTSIAGAPAEARRRIAAQRQRGIQ